MLVGESDSYAGDIGRPDRDDRIVAIGIVCFDSAWMAKAVVREMRAFPRIGRLRRNASADLLSETAGLSVVGSGRDCATRFCETAVTPG